MMLRHKLALLAFLYIAALAGNVALCSWCVIEYHTILAEGSGVPSVSAARTVSWSGGFDQSVITQILLLNTLLAIGIAVVGLRIVRRWIMRPITTLQTAAVQIAGGDLRHRVRVTGRDELSALGGAVNQMADEVLRMQAALVEQERREVASRALRCVVHNIRSPLTGVRWLAEALMARATLPPALNQREARIVRSVDGILQWLQAFRDSLAGVALQKRKVAVIELLADLESWVRGRELSVVAAGPEEIEVDVGHFRAALEAVVSYAARSSRPRDRLELSVRVPEDEHGLVAFTIQAAGCEEVNGKAATLPPAGTIAMAERIIRLHGGRLTARQDAGGRMNFTVIVPAD